MNVFHIFLFLAPNRSHFYTHIWLVAPKRRHFGAKSHPWHQKWCLFREWNFCRGIKIDAILITSSLIPSGESHLSRCFWKISLIILLLHGNPFIAPSLIPSGKGHFLSSFQKISPQPIQQLSEPKNDTFPETFFKKCSHPSTARFRTKKRKHFFKKVSYSYTASFFGQI